MWNEKFRTNVSRDKKNIQRLIEEGWRVIVIWECGLKVSGQKEKLDWLPPTITSGTDSYVEWPMIGNKVD
jgi:DNA mismatch endonuclease (patch repair protein)